MSNEGAWYQCVDTQDTALLKPFLLLMLRPLCGFGSAIWQKRVLDVTWGRVEGSLDSSPREGTCICSGVLCAVLGEFPSQAMVSCSFPALEMPKHITDTNKPGMRQPRRCIDVWLMRVGIWSCLSFVLECRTTLGLQWALHLTVTISCEGMAGALMGEAVLPCGITDFKP